MAAQKTIRRGFENVALRATEWTGSVWAFVLAVGIIVVWAITGPLFHFSDTWQLVINTGTTIVTFLMVFLIQHTQNRDTRALHLKLNELVAAVEGASDELIGVEELDEMELDELQQHFRDLVKEMREREKRGQRASLDELLSELHQAEHETVARHENERAV